MKTRVIIFFCILSLFTACKGPKYYTKLGAKQEASGLSVEASESYFSALRQKRNYVEAQAGMKRTGQIVLNQKLVDFGRKKTMNTPRCTGVPAKNSRDWHHVGDWRNVSK
jgi:hypothetical protein